MLLIKICERNEEVSGPLASLWAKRLGKIMEKLPKTVGEIVCIGQWLHTASRRDFLAECTNLARAEFGESPNVQCLCQSWGMCHLLCKKG